MIQTDYCPSCRNVRRVTLEPLVPCSCQPDAIEAQQEKVAKLRGECGRLRAAIKNASDMLDRIPDKNRSLVVRVLRSNLNDALAVPFSEEQG